MGDPNVYNPPKADHFFGKGTVNSQGPFVDVRQRVTPGLFTEVDRYVGLLIIWPLVRVHL